MREAKSTTEMVTNLQTKLDVQDNLDGQITELIKQKEQEQDEKIIERQESLKQAAHMKELKTLKELIDKDVVNLKKELAVRQNQEVEAAVFEKLSSHRDSESGR